MPIVFESDAVIDSAVSYGIMPPLIDGLVGYFEHFGGDLTRARTNLVDGTLATVVGAVTVAADGIITTSNSAYLQTAMPETAQYTRYSIAQIIGSPDGTSAGTFALSGNFVSGQGGSNMTVRAPSSGANPPAGRVMGTSYTSTAVAVEVAVADVTGWHLRAHRFRTGTGAGMSAFDVTAGVKNTTLNAAARVPYAGANTRIGGGAATMSGQVKHFLTAEYNVAHTDAEVEATMAAFLRVVAASQGITV
jgi:hypothetical protein